MAVQAKTVYIAACDLCGLAFGQDLEDVDYHFDTAQAALAYATDSDRWITSGGRLICPASDQAHDQARIPGVLL
ncbi:hypothetical protein ACH4GE_24620 [Streptomyces tendae]|uniref:hypothetical protein n=1 Tax=Streptomyces tendae TaxID=1932 RepID=UPI0037B3E81C